MINRIHLALKSMNELGFTPMAWLLIYRLGLYSGFWRFKTPSQSSYPDYLSSFESEGDSSSIPCRFPFPVPSDHALKQCTADETQHIIAEADEIVAGKIRYFSDKARPFEWDTGSNPVHWSAYEMHRASYAADDVKVIWEPGRFCWAYTLCRAFIISNDEKYLHTFWQHTVDFLEANPPNCGPHWTSAQEVALRLLALLFADHVFATSSSWSMEQRKTITNAVIAHAQRIAPTISYARAQNNNHLLSEALGLYAAGVSIPQWHQASGWQKTGWQLINEVIRNQISDDGTYTQHSTNYHRLMLQAMIWISVLAKSRKQEFSQYNKKRIIATTQWLFARMDAISGKVPNLGHNDGAYIFPLAAGGYADYRPVLQAAALAFLDAPCLPAGLWDEFSLWAGMKPDYEAENIDILADSPAVHKLGDGESWGTLRAVHFRQRPAHADQLHVDLWWKGHNIALDAGTYSYNSPAPWTNSLKHTHVHNTVTIEQRDQMTAAGRFLWLDWAQALLIIKDRQKKVIVAEHDGYRSSDVTHRRRLHYPEPLHWHITDEIIPVKKQTQRLSARVHWLLPDYPWEIDDSSLALSTPFGKIELSVFAQAKGNEHLPEIRCVQLVRAGEVLYGPSGNDVQLGWYSPTYYCKQPALSFSVTFSAEPPFSMVSTWHLMP